jgi:Na+/H+ antiporter NhaC
VNQCDDDEKKNEKEKSYKNVFEISFSTIIIAIIIIIIVIIIIEKDEYEEYIDHFENFDYLFVCFVESFDFLSSLKKKK